MLQMIGHNSYLCLSIIEIENRMSILIINDNYDKPMNGVDGSGIMWYQYKKELRLV